MTALRMEGVRAGYGSREALRGVDLSVSAGEVVGVVGPNGAGKSTLVRVVVGLLPPRAGRVEILGDDQARLSRRALARRVALVPQAPPLDLPWTVAELVLFGRAPHLGLFGLEGPADREAARRAMEEAQVLHLADRPVTELSGGERQRAWLAKALAQAASLLVLDEPTAHLDVGHQLALCSLVRRVAARGAAVVAVLHDLNLAALTCDRVLVLHEGRPAGYGPPHEVLQPERIAEVFGVRLEVAARTASGAPLLVPGALG